MTVVPPRMNLARSMRGLVDKFLNNPTWVFEVMSGELPLGKVFGLLALSQVIVLAVAVNWKFTASMSWKSNLLATALGIILMVIIVTVVGKTSKKTNVGMLDALWVWGMLVCSFIAPNPLIGLVLTALYLLIASAVVAWLSKNIRAARYFATSLIIFFVLIWGEGMLTSFISNGIESGRWSFLPVDMGQVHSDDLQYRKDQPVVNPQTLPGISGPGGLVVLPGEGPTLPTLPEIPGISAADLLKRAEQYCNDGKLPSGLPPGLPINNIKPVLDRYCKQLREQHQPSMPAENPPTVNSTESAPGLGVPTSAPKPSPTPHPPCKEGEFWSLTAKPPQCRPAN